MTPTTNQERDEAMGGTETSSQRILAQAKELVNKFNPGASYPPGLLTAVYKAIRDAETRGFGECLAYFTDEGPANQEHGEG